MEAPLRARIALVAAAAVSVALPACLGSGDDDPIEVPNRVDSTMSFQGERAAVASHLERWEQAVLADDISLICDQLVGVLENHGNDNDNGGRRFCERDSANDPNGLIAAAGGEDVYDLIVRDIQLDNQQAGRLRAVARITTGQTREIVSLRSSERAWRIVARAFPDRSGKPSGGDCQLDVIVGVNLSAPANAKTPRQAALRGPFAGEARRLLMRGGSFELAGITYAADYSHLYELRDAQGRLISQFPVGVWGPRSYDASSKYFCRNGEGFGAIVL